MSIAQSARVAISEPARQQLSCFRAAAIALWKGVLESQREFVAGLEMWKVPLVEGVTRALGLRLQRSGADLFHRARDGSNGESVPRGR